MFPASRAAVMLGLYQHRDDSTAGLWSAEMKRLSGKQVHARVTGSAIDAVHSFVRVIRVCPSCPTLDLATYIWTAIIGPEFTRKSRYPLGFIWRTPLVRSLPRIPKEGSSSIGYIRGTAR